MSRGGGEIVLLVTLSAAVLLSFGSCGQENLTPINNGCICPGGVLRLNCTAVGDGITTWTGTAFGQAGCSPISLSHNRFEGFINNTEMRFCPDTSPVINIRPLSIVNDSCYTSQLTIPSLSAMFDRHTIICQHDTTTTTNIGTHTIVFTTESFNPPSDISLSTITTNELTFTWGNVAPNCVSLSYGVNSSGCGTCPMATNSTSVTCTGVRLSGGVEMCSISVRAVTCGNLIGDYSTPLTMELQAANTPNVTVNPRYGLNSGLISFMVVIEELEPVSISGNDVIVQSIQVNYTTSDVPACSSSLTQSCDQGVCRNINVTTSSSSCTIGDDSTVTISVAATSILGMGPTTTLSIDGSSRNFVDVSSSIENTTRLIVTCEFTNPLDSSNKFCDITYGICGQQLSETAEGDFSPGEPNIVRVMVDLSGPADTYCFNVTASNATFTATLVSSIPPTTTEPTTEVEGTSTPEPDPGSDAGLIVGIVILAVVVIGGASGGTVGIYIGVKKYKGREREPKQKPPKQVHFNGSNPDESIQVQIIDDIKYPDIEAGQTPTKDRKQMEEDSLPPTPAVAATSPLIDTFEKHQGQVPVSITRYRGEETLEALIKQYWVPEGWTMRKMERRIRKKDLGLEGDQPLYLTIDNETVVDGSLTLKEAYSTNYHKGDKHLHIAYSSKDITDLNAS